MRPRQLARAPGAQLPPTPSPGLGADRPALPKGGRSPGFDWDVIPTVDIDDEPPAPAAKAAAAPSTFGQTAKAAPAVSPAQLAQGRAAAASAAPRVMEPAEIPHPTAAEAFERANAVLRARETELREVKRQLAIALATASDAQQEVQRLSVQCACWRRQQKQNEASAEARDAELRELRGILCECEDRLAVARAMLFGFLER